MTKYRTDHDCMLELMLVAVANLTWVRSMGKPKESHRAKASGLGSFPFVAAPAAFLNLSMPFLKVLLKLASSSLCRELSACIQHQ